MIKALWREQKSGCFFQIKSERFRNTQKLLCVHRKTELTADLILTAASLNTKSGKLLNDWQEEGDAETMFHRSVRHFTLQCLHVSSYGPFSTTHCDKARGKSREAFYLKVMS